uniref:Uncharacterized protein LOC117364707 n=1 Tax=Geotrypetes seraphini TaxID=260995 RepID=A0A6P8RWI5_GEOSA|nr:uncharacterized protein LOC117364707 [Geotrypetes seraphini]
MATSKAGKKRSIEPASPSKSTAKLDEETASSLLTEFRALRTLLGDMKSDLDEIKSEFHAFKAELTDLNRRVDTVESQLAMHTENIKALQRQTKRITLLEAELADGNNRARRNNFRILGLPESREGRDLVKFLETTLPKLLDLEFSHAFEIERAHRIPSRQPTNPTKYPRPVIVKLLRYPQVLTIMQQARLKSPIKLDSHTLLFVPDLCKQTAKARKQLLEYRPRLKQMGACFGMLYPAKLRVTYNNSTKDFTSPLDLADYIESLSPSEIDKT